MNIKSLAHSKLDTPVSITITLEEAAIIYACLPTPDEEDDDGEVEEIENTREVMYEFRRILQTRFSAHNLPDPISIWVGSWKDGNVIMSKWLKENK